MAYQTPQSGRNPPREGDQFTISLTPPIPPGCTLSIIIDGKQALPGDTIGGLKLLGFGVGPSGASATVEARRNDPQAVVKFEIKCPEKRPTFVEHGVGRAWQEKLEKEWPGSLGPPPQHK